MVFQSYALYPHMSVYDNIAFGLKLRSCRRPRSRRACRTRREILELEPLLKRKPKALSGGQRQRVAIGRAIVRQPQAFLMDEPLSNLDAKLRVQMRAEISELQRDLGVTTIYVTHDQVEAMTMGDRIAVMREGELQQVDDAAGALRPPGQPLRRRLHRQPGDEPARGDACARTATMEVVARPQQIRLGQHARPAAGAAGYEAESRARHPAGGPRGLPARGRVGARRRLKGTVELRRRSAPRSWCTSRSRPPAITEDVKELAEDVGEDRVADGGDEGDGRLVGRFGARSRVKPGEQIDVAVDTRQLHFFDPETGLGIYGANGAS